MKKPSPELSSLLDEMMSGQQAVRRTMFGCPCYFVNGNMQAGVYEDSIFIRLAEPDRKQIRAEWDEVAPFSPGGQMTMREYIVLPESLLMQTRECQKWFERSLTFVRSLTPKEPKTRVGTTGVKSTRSKSVKTAGKASSSQFAAPKEPARKSRKSQ